MPKQSWSIIILCFNERDAIQGVVESTLAALKTMRVRQYEIVVVDDGSRDGSVDIIRKLERKYASLKGIYHERNEGIGQALRTGYAACAGDNVCMIPGDGQFDPRELAVAVEVPEGTIISFYRELTPGYTLFRRVLSAVNRLVNRYTLSLSLRDINWVKVYKGEALRGLELRMKSSLIESEICARLVSKGHRTLEYPSQYRPRVGGVPRGASLPILLKAASEVAVLIYTVWAARLSPSQTKSLSVPAPASKRAVGK